MTSPADGRGGSTPPRPAAPDSKPGQWFAFGPWVYDVDAATRLLRAAPRPALLLPVRPWARACGLIRDPGSDQQTISLIGPGPGFDPGYAMTTDLGDPVIIATITTAAGEPAGPLLIDGYNRLYKAGVTGREHLPSLWLTAAETLAIRQPVILGPGPGRAARRNREPAAITVTIWHNIAVDGQGHHTGMLDGYQPGDPMVRVFTYQAAPASSPEDIAEEAFGICNGHPRGARGADLARRYYERELRSLSAGDMVIVGEAALIVARAGFQPLTGTFTAAHRHEHGTHPID